ncbi:MAG: NUDIX domain-containing protein [Bacteroidales bacterium]|nr:NUDIX domain-containing protein [Bacteroidales bacterium]
MRLPSEKEYLSHIAYDSVIFGFSGKELKILVMKYHHTGHYALPGGFVRRDEDLSAAVERGVGERTGLSNIYLEQFHTFGSLRRHDPGTMRDILEARGLHPGPTHWMLDRYFSIAYYALINYKNVDPKPDSLSDSIDWYHIHRLPPLMLDHNEIVSMALQTLRNNLDRKLIGVNLLPEKFTMKELQEVHEAILEKKLRRTSFQRKMLSLEILDRHEKRYSGEAHKAPYLYSFKK